jgi:hypothetical protein
VFNLIWKTVSPSIGLFFEEQELKIKSANTHKNGFRIRVVFLIL